MWHDDDHATGEHEGATQHAAADLDVNDAGHGKALGPCDGCWRFNYESRQPTLLHLSMAKSAMPTCSVNPFWLEAAVKQLDNLITNCLQLGLSTKIMVACRADDFFPSKTDIMILTLGGIL